MRYFPVAIYLGGAALQWAPGRGGHEAACTPSWHCAFDQPVIALTALVFTVIWSIVAAVRAHLDDNPRRFWGALQGMAMIAGLHIILHLAFEGQLFVAL